MHMRIHYSCLPETNLHFTFVTVHSTSMEEDRGEEIVSPSVKLGGVLSSADMKKLHSGYITVIVN